jgi:pSer/pThr/pTyr-binding forkhead associated (FHA) protein
MDKESTLRPDATHPYLEGTYENAPMLMVLGGTLKGKEFRLTNEEYTIGRTHTADIAIDETTVSRQHALIIRKNSEFLLSDLGSSNGIFINNIKMDRAALRNGDVFQIGSCVFQFIWKRR